MITVKPLFGQLRFASRLCLPRPRQKHAGIDFEKPGEFLHMVQIHLPPASQDFGHRGYSDTVANRDRPLVGPVLKAPNSSAVQVACLGEEEVPLIL